MVSGSPWSALSLRWTAAALAGCVVVAGCASRGVSLESTPEVTLLDVQTPLHSPVWSYSTHSLIALTDDHRLAKVSDTATPGAVRTALSAPLDVGRNLQISRRDGSQIFVPQPRRGTVAVIDMASLRPTDHFNAGPAPNYLAEDAGIRVLLALSADGSSVTPVDQYGYHKLPTANVDGDRLNWIDGANRGRAIDYRLYGPSGIRYYTGPSSPPAQHGDLAINVVVSAGDATKPTRSYVAGRDDDTLYAVDLQRSQAALAVVGHVRLPSPIRYLGTDDTRLYATTDRELVTLETSSFIGYPHGTIPVLRVIDYRAILPGGEQNRAPLSGMAIGPHRVYLTLAGSPNVVSIAKPRL